MHRSHNLIMLLGRLILPAAATFCVPAMAQPSAAAAAAAAGSTSTTANGGSGGVGLGGEGPAVSAYPGSNAAVGTSSSGRASGNGAIVGPRAKKEAQDLIADRPGLQGLVPANPGQRSLMLEREQRDPVLPAR